MKRNTIVIIIVFLFIGLAIAPSLNSYNIDPISDLDCNGDLDFTDVVPGATVSGMIIVENTGDPESLLDWEIMSWPDWGTWTFTPNNGVDLLAGDTVEIDVEVIWPDPDNSSGGEVKIVNIENVDDFCTVELPICISSLEDDFVEFNVELCGLGKKHTVKLTQQEYDDVELIFNEVQDKLSNFESDDEAVDIFNEAIVKLDKYGLLGGLSVKQTQRFISRLQRLKENKFFQRIVSSKTLDDNENKLCYIAGQITHADFFRLITMVIRIFYVIALLFNFKKIINLYSSISVSHQYWEHEGNGELFKSNGNITTIGLNGLIEFNGELKGCLETIEISFVLMSNWYYVGIQGFFGVQITNPNTKVSNFFGFAKHVKMDYW